MRSIFLLCIAACAVFACCSVSEAELKRAVAEGDFSFAEAITLEFASKATEKNPELPLFLALGLLAKEDSNPQSMQAAAVLLSAAAGLSRDSSGFLCISASLQRKIPFLNRAAALFRLCTLTRQAATAYSADYAGGPLSAELEALRGDILFLETLLNGENKGFLLPAESGVEFPLSSLRRFASAERSLSDALALTEPFPVDGYSSIEDEAAVLRRLVLERHYNAAAALFFRIVARFGYTGKSFSIPAMEGILPSPLSASETDESFMFTRDFLSAAGRALLYSAAESADSAAALEYLLDLPAFRDGGGQAWEARYVLKFYLARIFAKMPDRVDTAFALMESSLSDAPTEEDRDFSLWYMFDIARSGGNEPLLDLIEARLSEWHDPEVFSDILTSLITDLTAVHSLASLLRLEAALPENTPSSIRERVLFAVALLSSDGSPEERQRLEFLAENAESLYYRIRSAELLGRDNTLLQWEENPHGEGMSGARAFPVEFQEQAAALIRACLDWNLPGQAAAFAEDFPFAEFSTAKDVAQRLIKADYRTEGMRLLSAAFSQLAPEAERIESASRETMEMLYPQVWHSEVAAAAASTQRGDENALDALPESLIFAVIRQESFFDPNAVSHAGAKGLMQLMDLTAAEVAGKLNVSEYNLFSPEISIRFGSFYLSEMKRRLSGQSIQAVCAYNAGLSRVRGWLRDFPPDLPGKSPVAEECLFLESVPFGETRDYAKRVFTSASIYSALYY